MANEDGSARKTERDVGNYIVTGTVKDEAVGSVPTRGSYGRPATWPEVELPGC